METTKDPNTRLEELEAAFYACLDLPGEIPEGNAAFAPAGAKRLLKAPQALLRVAASEKAIRTNRDGKKGIPDCPCWGNATLILDQQLYRVLDGDPLDSPAAALAKN